VGRANVTTDRIPLFPLHSVLFPGGPLVLRVFEPRYLDMVSRCLKEESGFGVVLIKEGEETGRAAETCDVGTYVRITYWNRRADGLLGVTVRGERRFRILTREVQPDQLLMAEVELLPDEPRLPLPPGYEALAALLKSILEQLDHPYLTLPREFDDATWVAARLAELLPIPRQRKQQLLESDDPLLRLKAIQAAVAASDF
jgi:Lon protease-like protein